jgi:hypothetical protein
LPSNRLPIAVIEFQQRRKLFYSSVAIAHIVVVVFTVTQENLTGSYQLVLMVCFVCWAIELGLFWSKLRAVQDFVLSFSEFHSFTRHLLRFFLNDQRLGLLPT